MENHLAIHVVPGNDHPCRVCCLSFTSTSLLEEHIRTHPEFDYENADCTINCISCGHEFRSQVDLYNHERTHSIGIKSQYQECPTCKRKFPTEGTLNAHRKTHESNYECQECQHSFKSEKAYNNHMKIHTQKKPFPCQYCPASFGFKSNLREHEKHHENRRQYNCKYCSLMFYRPATLYEHVNAIHLKVKKYSCQYCYKAFAQRSVCIKHERSIHRPCQSCEFRGSKIELKDHQLEHTSKNQNQ